MPDERRDGLARRDHEGVAHRDDLAVVAEQLDDVACPLRCWVKVN